MLPVDDGTEYNIYPPELHDPYRAPPLQMMDESALINSLRTERAALDEFATLQGFEI